MKVQVKYKHHYELFEIEIPVEAVLYPGDVFIISKTIRIERHPVATTASVVIGDLTYSGNSKCHKKDQFSKKEGREIALARLVQQLIKCDFDVTVVNQFELDVVKRDVQPVYDNPELQKRHKKFMAGDVYGIVLTGEDGSTRRTSDIYVDANQNKPECTTQDPSFKSETDMSKLSVDYGVAGIVKHEEREGISKLATLGELCPDIVPLTTEEFSKLSESEQQQLLEGIVFTDDEE